MGKQHQDRFPKGGAESAVDMLQLIYRDVVGSAEIKSLGGTIYFINFIDGYCKKA